MNCDPVLVSLVKMQTKLFNQNATETERVLIYGLIQEYQKNKAKL